jgi:cell division protein FtsB
MGKILVICIVLLAIGGIVSFWCVLKIDKVAQSYRRDNIKLIRSKVELTKEVVQLRDSLNHCAFYVIEIDPDSLHLQNQ